MCEKLALIKPLHPVSSTVSEFESAGERVMHIRFLMFVGFIFLLLLPMTVSAQGIVNRGFEESPDLNGWTLSPGGVGSAPTTLNGVVNPTEGARFGFITTAGSTGTTQFGGTSGTILTQTFNADEGSTITLDYNFLTNEGPPNNVFNDFGRGELLDSNGNVIAQIFNANTFSPFISAAGSGFNSQTDWRTATVTVPNTGTFTLRFIVSDAGDAIVDSGLALDNVRLVPKPPLVISEYRLRGPNGADDEFIELYNPKLNAVTVTTTDGSPGWALVASDGATRFVIPNGTVIPARGHYLGVNTIAYSLGNYPAGHGATATGDANYTIDIPDRAGIALFKTADPLNFNLENRSDAVGYALAPALYREGAGFPANGAETFTNLEYSFVRNLTTGISKDTNDNLADFVGIETSGVSTGLGNRLGAPGPENLSSPVERTGQITASLLDPLQSNSAVPNRVRSATSVPNGSQGTLDIRRTFTNNTGNNVTRLRYRLVDITTFPAPSGTADLRAITSSDITVMRTDGSAVLVRGTTLEEPPAQSSGGGLNSTLSAGTITLGTPLAPGTSINVRFLLGVQQSGSFRFFVTVEALP